MATLLCLAGAKAEASVTWTLDGVAFADGATATGTFTYTSLEGDSRIDITVSGASLYAGSAHSFTTADVNATVSTFNTLLHCDGRNTCAAGTPLIDLVTQDSYGNTSVPSELLLTGTSTTGTRYGLSGSPKRLSGCEGQVPAASSSAASCNSRASSPN